MSVELQLKYGKDLRDLIAYVVQLDSKSAEKKIEYINRYVKEYYSADVVDEVFKDFLATIKNTPTIDSILERINKKYENNYTGKLHIIIKIHDLINFDQTTEKEKEVFDYICKNLKIKELDIALINYLIFDPTLENSVNTDISSSIRKRTLKIGDDPQYFDIIYPDTNLVIFELESRYFLIKRSTWASVFVDTSPVYSKQIVPLTGKDHIFINYRQIRISDIPYYFTMKNKNLKKKIHLKYDASTLESLLTQNDADFSIFTEANINILKKHNKSLSLKINKIEVIDETFVNLNDELLIDNHYKLFLRDILFNEQNVFILQETDTIKDQIIISNKKENTDILLDLDDKSKELLITVKINKLENRTEFIAKIDKTFLPIFVEKKKLQEKDVIEINTNTTMRIEKYQLVFDCSQGKIFTYTIRFSTFVVKNLVYMFNKKKNIVGIDNISFRAKAGELNCIMGSSGAGKSTLINLLLGFYKPTSGNVYINGVDFYKNFNKIKHFIGYVPQDDLCLENLTVFENLYYAAKIRMPEKNEKDILAIIDKVLIDIGLNNKKHLKVGNPTRKILSGGQRKRLNIGLELLSDPDLFFLDEPTSGLSSKDAEIIIDILAKLAERGKILFVSIHQPSSDIYKRFNNLILLDHGGKLVYFGGVIDALYYFQRHYIKSLISEDPERAVTKTIGEILIEMGYVKPEDINVAMKLQSKPLGEILVEMNKITREQLNNALNYQRKINANKQRKGLQLPTLYSYDKSEKIIQKVSNAMSQGTFGDYVECALCGTVNPELIFEVLEEKEIGNDGNPVQITVIDPPKNLFEKIKYFFNIKNKSLVYKRRHDANYWKQLYESKLKLKQEFAEKEEVQKEEEPEIALPYYKKQNIFTRLKVLFTLIRRSFIEKVHDRSNMIMVFLAPILLGYLMGSSMKGGIEPYLFYYNKEYPKYLFLSVIVFIFFGLMASITQILRDRPIIMREKIVDIKPWQYLFSKSLVFLFFSIIQTSLFITISFNLLKVPITIPQELYLYAPLYLNFIYYAIITGVIISFTAYNLGLLISSFLRSELAGFYMIVIVVVLQIVFGGMFIEFKNMKNLLPTDSKSVVPPYCNLIFSRWGYEALLVASENLNPLYITVSYPEMNSLKRDNKLLEINKLKKKVNNFIPERISEDLFNDKIIDKLEELFSDKLEEYERLMIDNTELFHTMINYYTDPVSITNRYKPLKAPESFFFNYLFERSKKKNNYKLRFKSDIKFISMNNDIGYFDTVDFIEIPIFDNDITLNIYMETILISELLKDVIKYEVYINTIKKYYKLKKFGGKKFYVLQSKDQKAFFEITKIFSICEFNTIYNNYNVNEKVHDMLYGADNDSFPANEKKLFNYEIPVPYYNLIVLIVFCIILNALTLYQLKNN